jgi:CDP-glycerol glycerophosphotransferase (TagB/SpsB family)
MEGKEFQKCKYEFHLNIVDNNRNLYNKTDYLFADFFLANLSSDDTYPIFEKMIKTNNKVHYITQNKNIYKKYCRLNNICLTIIRDYIINGDFLEKYLDLILKLKVAISGSEFVTVKENDNIFYNIEYITSLNVGHGIKYFKSFLYKHFSNYKRYNKLLLTPSKKIISVALKYGWKEENIIKMCLPKWDKYNKYNIMLFNKKKNKKSIFIFFTKRELLNYKTISLEYINNIIKIINNKILSKELIKNNITLYYCLHQTISYFKYMIKNNNNKQYRYIRNHDISSILIKSSLLVTDFSSITFDFIYQRKPVIMYIPDLKDPMIKKIYDEDYYELIKDIKTGKIYFENRLNSPKQVINKIIYYINHNFKLEHNLKEYYNSFQLKCEKNITQSFIKYIENLK